MNAPRSVRWAVRSFTALVRLLPNNEQARNSDEMGSLFRQLAEDAHDGRGVPGLAWVWIRSIFDLLFGVDMKAATTPRRRRRFPLADALWQDLRLSARSLLVKPVSTLLAVASLAVGMAVTVGIFTFVDSILWSGWSFNEPDRVIQVFEEREQYSLPTWRTYLEVSENIDLFDGVIASQLDLFAVGEGQGARTLVGERINDQYFQTLGNPAELGRYPDENTSAQGALPLVLSHYAWVNYFGAEPEILGRQVRVNSYPGVVVAITPAVVDGTKWGVSADLWTPMKAWAEVAGWSNWETDSGNRITLMARMKPGIDVQVVNQALASLGVALRETQPEAYGQTLLVATDRLRGDMGPRIGYLADLIAFAAIGSGVLVLLVGCGNVASLLLAQGVTRSKEIAVRYALGASRGRIIRRLLTESLLLAGVAAVVGLILSSYGAAALVDLLPTFDFRVRVGTRPGPHSMLLAAGLIILTVVMAGLAPALHLSRADLAGAMKTDARSGTSRLKTRLLRSVVVGMVGSSVLALFLAGAFARTLSDGMTLRPGFETANRLRAVVPLRLAGYDWEDATALYEDLERRLAEVPGIVSVGYGTGIPLGEAFESREVYAADGNYSLSDPGIRSFRSSVSDNYFRAMGTRIVKGRAFGTQDGPEGPWVAIINEELAARLWPGQEAVGKQIRFGLDDDADPVEVVGIAETGVYYQVGESPEPAVFASFRQWAQPQAMVVVQTVGDPLAMVESFRAEVRATDPNIPLQRVRTMEAHFIDSLWLQRLGAGIGSIVSIIAVLLAAAGLYGVMSFTLRARQHEMGIRRALGAGNPEVLGLAIGGAFRMTLWGLLLGAILSALAGAGVRAVLPAVDPWDPSAALLTVLFILAVGLLAGLVPGLSASRVDPIVALKVEG